LAPTGSLISKAPVMRSGPLDVTWMFVSLMGVFLDDGGARKDVSVHGERS
jgi:hypothetical protein